MMNNKKIIVLTALVFGFIISTAHEFWLQPQKYFFTIGEQAKINFKVGEEFTGEPWDLKRHRVEKLEVHSAARAQDVKDQVQEGKVDNLTIDFKQAGTHLVVMQSNHAFIELEGDKFNSYLKEDGLDDVYNFREKNNLLEKSAREFYSRHTKLLLQVGEKKDDTFKKVIGLPIEIIPEKNPYAIKKGEKIKFTILFEGKPLFGALVKVWNKKDGRTMLQNIYTEKNGMIETTLSNSGDWMVSVVKMVPSKDAGADWRSHWGSLVFGVE